MKIALVIILCGLFTGSVLAMEPGRGAIPVFSKNPSPKEFLALAKVGCGYYPIPEGLQGYVSEVVKFAHVLNESEAGYYNEPKQQFEMLYLEKKDWNKYPKAAQALAKGMNELATHLVYKILEALGVPEDLFSQVTGGLTNFEGLSFFKIVRYDATRNKPGLLWHKDLRFITLLFIDQEGLQGKVDGAIVDVQPKEGTFFINLGIYFEALINDANKLVALEHQVKQVSKDRISFGIFCEGQFAEKGCYRLIEKELSWKGSELLTDLMVKENDDKFTIGPHMLFNSHNPK